MNDEERAELMEQPQLIRHAYLFDLINPEDKDYMIKNIDDEYKNSFL